LRYLVKDTKRFASIDTRSSCVFCLPFESIVPFYLQSSSDVNGPAAECEVLKVLRKREYYNLVQELRRELENTHGGSIRGPELDKMESEIEALKEADWRARGFPVRTDKKFGLEGR
jgi:hypothetical protein